MDRSLLARLAPATVLLWALTGIATPARAQVAASSVMAVSVEVAPNCTVAASPLDFGARTADEAPSRQTTAIIDIACGSPQAFTIGLDEGQNASAGARRALDPVTGRYVGYDIYADAAHTRRWGTLGSDSVAGVTSADGTGRLTAYAGIESETQVTAGRYGDLITVTTNF